MHSQLKCVCCDQGNELDKKYFWDNVRKNGKKWKNTLIFEKNIHLHDEYESAIVIGVNPYNKFAVCARIEVRAMQSALSIDGDSMINLLNCIDKRFGENTVFPDTQSKNNLDVTIQLARERLYKIGIVGGTLIKMSLNALLAMRQKHSLIKKYIVLLKCEERESLLFNLLNHFSFEAREEYVRDALSTCKRMHKQYFFDEMCRENCTCLDISFTLEIALHCSDWFASCVPIFIKALTHNGNCAALDQF